MRKDKVKVLDEVLSDAQVQSFLFLDAPVTGGSADYHCIIRAYRGMVARDFARFISFFMDAGRNLEATGPDGQTALEVIGSHASSGEYAEILRAVRAG